MYFDDSLKLEGAGAGVLFILEQFRGLSLWDLVGGVSISLLWFFSFDFSPKSVSKGARF
jgi:hypothetical protein